MGTNKFNISMANTSGSGKETDSIRDWESKVSVELRRKESQLILAKKEKLELEKEVNKLIIENGEVEQAIKAELDEIKQYDEMDKILTEKIAELEANLKLLRRCIEKQRECLNVCGVAQAVQEGEKKELKNRIKGEAANYEDKLSVAKKELQELESEYACTLELKQKTEKTVDADFEELQCKIQLVDLEINKLSMENQTDETFLVSLEQECMELKSKVVKKKLDIEKVTEEFALRKVEEASLESRIKVLNNKLQSEQDSLYSSKQKQCKLHCQIKELLEKEDSLKCKKASLQMEILDIKKVVTELDNLNVHVENVSLQVQACQNEAERLSGIGDAKKQVESELSELLEKSALTSSNIEALNEEFCRLESIESRKANLDELINAEKSLIESEVGKRDENQSQLSNKEKMLEELAKECENSCNKVSQTEISLHEKQNLLQNTIRPRMEELKRLKDVVETADIEVSVKEKEKNEMLMYVSRRTNEASLQSKAKLDELKASLDEKMNLFKDTSSMVEKLEQEVSVQEEFLEGELERVNREEKKKIENAVEPVLRNYEDRRSKEVEKQWQEELTNANKILSPAERKKVQFSTKGVNLETSSPIVINLDSQDKTNRPPKLAVFPKQPTN